ncbi:MAG: Bax inhibitor-1/YccA family protein [Rhodospirillales bacterium]|nr:Bax inhibitor-1/YccA family protein [Rhodospirillales bacterium]MCW8863175.1 Bax inhibitor-1/YccA family protein [Rhodospirillales bacterium]MCW8952005.1 Bax inhibitor-1/YccA family protein [Rhodospirillales bacterium]MCW8971562.1 Bax inhibitor-1/YccA family protein [Rhodospirillales bacterium]MCW9002278.1 Bax inhibitor-1/YccA family protein [Rhodospirillales bacterium]
MAFGSDPRLMTGAEASAAHIDVGLRTYMLRVYNYMASGLALTGAVAYGVSQSEAAMQAIFGTPLFWVVALAPIGMVFFLSARIHSMKAGTAQALFWVFAGLMGLSLASIFIAFTGASIARVFFITAATFGALSLYGYTTKRDLAGWGSFLFMGLIGIIIASIVNLFMESSALHFVISVVGVLVFTGLTAYDTQRIKAIYLESDAAEVHEKKAILGALTLYLDFINLFIMLLHLFGNRE